MYTCNQFAYNEPKYVKCYFESVSRCGDHASSLICNEHLNMFGLQAKVCSYLTGDNNQHTCTELFVCADNNLNIPLFLNSTGDILEDEIYNFVNNVCVTMPTYNTRQKVLFDLIKKLCESTHTFLHNGLFNSWIDNDSSKIIIHGTEVFEYNRKLPLLHRILFHHAHPSFLKNVKANKSVTSITNVKLVYDDATGRSSFVMSNKEMMLKLTKAPNCVALPVVLDALAEIHDVPNKITIQPATQFMIC